MFKLVLEKAEEPGIKLPTSAGSSQEQENSRKNIYFCFIDYAKVFDCVDHNKLWKILQEMGIRGHLTCLLRNLYAGQATVKTGHETTDWFQIGKGVLQGCILSPYILDESQAWIKIVWRNINNLRYETDSILMAEDEEELKRALMKVKEESQKAGWKLSIQKTKITATNLIIMAHIRGKSTNNDRFCFLGIQNYCGHCLKPWN